MPLFSAPRAYYTTRSMKKALLGLAGLVLLVVAVVAALFVPVFTGVKPSVNGTHLEGGAVQVLDGYVSAFLLPAGDGAVALVDCGNDPSGTGILEALRLWGLGPEAVKAIFLTHGHPDHLAACHLFKDAEVYAFAADAKIAAGLERPKGPVPSRFDTPPEKVILVTKMLMDGETVTVGTLNVKAYAVPGHTGGSAAFLADGVLYLGDSVSARSDGKTLKAAPWVFSDDTVQNLASLKKLHARLKEENAVVKLLAPAHSGQIEDVDALLTAGQ